MRFRRLFAVAAIAAVTVGCGGIGTRSDVTPLRSGNTVVEQAFAAGDKMVAIDLFGASPRQVTQLVENGFDMWAGSPAKGAQKSRVRGIINARQWQLIQDWGLQVVKLPNLKAFSHFDPKYATYDAAMADLKALAAKYSQICKLEEIGKSYEGRPILALHVGTGDLAKKPGVLFSGENHARELVTPEMVLRLAHWILEGYGKDAEATYAVDNRDIYLTPMVNPDGHVKAEKGIDWRKNTDPKNGGSGYAPNGPGVDLNRNYMSRNWGSTGTSTNPSSATYGGPGPNSEPEAQTMARLYASRKWTFLMTFHSFSNLVMWPWNDSDQAPDDPKMPAIGRKLGELSGYTPEQGSELYYTSGDDTDHMWSQHHAYAYCIEVGSWGDGFDPPYSRVDKFWNEVFPMQKYVLKIADNPGAVFGPDVSKGGRTADTVVRSASGRQIVLHRAQGSNGVWGPPEFSWAK